MEAADTCDQASVARYAVLDGPIERVKNLLPNPRALATPCHGPFMPHASGFHLYPNAPLILSIAVHGPMKQKCRVHADARTHVFAQVMGENSWAGTVRAWITKLTNTTTHQGWHDWHVDGAARNNGGTEIGRYHKIFIMVHKSGAFDLGGGNSDADKRAWSRERTNLCLVPNYAQVSCPPQLLLACS